MSAHVTASAVWTGETLELADVVAYQAGLRRMKLGIGEEVTVRVERPEDAAKYGQFKYLFGYVIEPVMTESGHTKLELAAMAKAQFMPDGKTSLTELNREELDAFTKATEEWLRQELPQAFETRREYVG